MTNTPNASFYPLREHVSTQGLGPGDALIIFGEVFGKGYVNGLIDACIRRGIKIIGSTVGRRDGAGGLRPLLPEELAQAREVAPFSDFINVPLEAGFDLEKSVAGTSPVDQLKGVKMDEWDQISINWDQVGESEYEGKRRFLAATQSWIKELTPKIAGCRRLLIAHTMAGGVPRAKILMPTMNKIFKGRGERHLSSKKFWESQLGRLCERTFLSVTADTFSNLISETSMLRRSHDVSYLAYGYHGTEILMSQAQAYTWQTYAPYVQGWAKMKLETLAEAAQRDGVRATVYNCPEILTNSSNLFNGVELPLYPFLAALQREAGSGPQANAHLGHAKEILEKAQSFLKDGVLVQTQVEMAFRYFQNQTVRSLRTYEGFPQHNWAEQMELMLQSSDDLQAGEADTSRGLMLFLSRLIFAACGHIMLEHSVNNGPRSRGSIWLGHDVLAREVLSLWPSIQERV